MAWNNWEAARDHNTTGVQGTEKPGGERDSLELDGRLVVQIQDVGVQRAKFRPWGERGGTRGQIFGGEVESRDKM